ncbi:MAG: dienelactone hydrolase family protein [Hyphomicrobiaceae bacterium]|nr:MAG: dienelactone hydrolase family protein [Hyphomicrobiaceae bacterium]
MRAILAGIIALLVNSLTVQAAEPSSVKIPTADPALKLNGYLLKPDGAGPFPAVVALHGCGGLFRKEAQGGRLSSRHADWADRLVAAGYVVLFPDSFGSRNAPGQCSVADRVASPRTRASDALAAARWLAGQSFVDPARLGLMGWSNGGSTVLWAVTRRLEAADADFKVAVAFYPGCRTPLERTKGNPRMPLTILMGAADDWTPPEPCEAFAKERGARIVLYPDAYHGFDSPNSKVRQRRNLAFTKNKDGKAHVGTNPAARQAAIAETMAIFEKALKGQKQP